jgi:hypothetical protein
LAKVPCEVVKIPPHKFDQQIFFERFNNLPVLVFPITNVSEGVRQEAQVAKACVFPLKY